MKHKKGLLPKCIFLSTTIKITLILYSLIYNYMKNKRIIFNYYYIAHFLLIVLRLVNIKNLCKPSFFIFITGTFILDVVIYAFEVKKSVVAMVEIFLTVLCIGWMVFLYPYYLVGNDEKKSK